MCCFGVFLCSVLVFVVCFLGAGGFCLFAFEFWLAWPGFVFLFVFFFKFCFGLNWFCFVVFLLSLSGFG